jgi:hypothetical protein
MRTGDLPVVALTSHEKQIANLFRGLPAERRSQVLLAMAGADPDAWKRYQQQGEQRLREHCRGTLIFCPRPKSIAAALASIG